ncbi:archease [Pseudothermotoga sp.]|nr:archease [Pseudothermotoga sp.]MCX7812792.1 archease [Pseudothermotoga sp.]MDW8139072.1 archease [Pseudothermotoga sp.]
MYRQLNHTADVRYEIVCHSEEQLFKEFINIFKDHYSVQLKEREVVVEYDLPESLEDAVFDIVNDWIYLLESKKLFPEDCYVEDEKLVCKFREFERIDGTELKAVTYHGLSVEKSDKIVLRVVFDT